MAICFGNMTVGAFARAHIIIRIENNRIKGLLGKHYDESIVYKKR